MSDKGTVFSGAGKFVGWVPKLAGWVAGLGSFTYLTGWIYSRSYFGSFGADWLIGDIPITTLVGFSWAPVGLVGVFAVLGISDLLDIEEKEQLETSRKYKTSQAILYHGVWVLIPIMVFQVIADAYRMPHFLIVTVDSLSVLTMILMATLAIEIMVVRLRTGATGQRQMFYLAIGVIVLGLYIVPHQMGATAGTIDKDGKSLPIARLKGIAEDYSVLLVNEDRVYVFPKQFENSFPPISIVSPNEIEWIKKIE